MNSPSCVTVVDCWRRERNVSCYRSPQLRVSRPGFLQAEIAAVSAGRPIRRNRSWKRRIVPQAVHARIYMKIDKPVGVLFVGFLQVFDRAVVFSQADVDSGEEVRRDILLLCQFCQIIEHLNASFVLPAAPRVCASAARIRGLPPDSFTPFSPSVMASS